MKEICKNSTKSEKEQFCAIVFWFSSNTSMAKIAYANVYLVLKHVSTEKRASGSGKPFDDSTQVQCIHIHEIICVC